jgi:hypothetical protein
MKMYMNHERNSILIAVGFFAALSLFVFPSTNMIAYSQSENKTQIKEQAEEKLFELTQKFNKILNESKVNLTLPTDGDLSAKLQELANSDEFKSLSEKFSQAVQELGQETRLKSLNNKLVLTFPN